MTPSQPTKATRAVVGYPYAVSELTQLHSNNISAIPSFLLQNSEFNVARHARPITYAAYPYTVQTKPSDIRLGLMQCQKEYNSERVGCRIESEEGKSQMHGGYRERKVFVMFVLLLLVLKSAEENGDRGGREWTCVATYRRMGERLC